MRLTRTNARIAAVAGLTTLGLLLTACGAANETNSSSATNSTGAAAGDEAAAGSITIEHKFGTTTIEGTPERIATVGWANHEVPLSLGVVPVGISKATWGDDDANGIMPWVEEKLTELGAETPVLFDETDGIPFEQIANAKPDVILAAYSGLTQDDYDKLSKIAPTIAQPGDDWATTLQDMVTMDSQGMNRETDGENLNTELESFVETTMAKFPELAGTKVLFSSFGSESNTDTIGFYTTGDQRAAFLESAGFGVPSIVEQESANSDQFFTEVSLEKPELFADVEVIVTYGSDDAAENAAALKALQENPLYNRIPAIRDGRVVYLGNSPLAAAANPSPLAMKWGLEDYLSMINEVVTRPAAN